MVRACTGSGKSGLLSRLAGLMAGPDGVVVISAPRVSLVEQLSGLEAAEVREEWGGGWRPGSAAWDVGGDRVGVYYGVKKQPDRPIVVTCNPSLPGLVEALAGRRCRALIVDEAHRSESPEFVAAVAALAPARVVGFSATPWRSDKAESLSIFDSVCYDYGIAPAIRDGVLVPWDTVGWDGTGDDGIDAGCIEMIRRYGDGPGIVSAASIADAEVYAEVLAAAGLPAAAIHSGLPPRERRLRIARLLSGDLRCLVHVALLQEGVDIPALRWLCMRRPTSTSIRFVQELGRILRTAPGKSRALLLDPYDLEGSIGLRHDPAIGPAAALDAALEPAPRTEGTGIAPPIELPPMIMVSEVTRWARRSLLALVEAGIAEAPLKGSRWREALPSESQLSTLRKIGGEAARAVLSHGEYLTRGEVSDMIGYLSAVRTAKRARIALPELPPVPESAVAAVARRGRK